MQSEVLYRLNSFLASVLKAQGRTPSCFLSRQQCHPDLKLQIEDVSTSKAQGPYQ